MARRRHHHGHGGGVTPPTHHTLIVNTAGSGSGKVTASGIDTPRKPWRGGGMLGLPQRSGDLAAAGHEWYYNWSYTSPVASAVPFVPMAYNGHSFPIPASINDLTGTKYLLGFNEPDAVSKVNHLTPDAAVALWPQLMATGRLLGSPATTTGATQWRKNFMDGIAANGYRVDFMCVHWYGDFSNPKNLVNYLNNVHTNYGLPIWLTEFSAYGGSLAANTAFIRNVGPLLAGLPFLERVGWFANRSIAGGGGYNNSGLVVSTNTLTSVGSAYKAWPKSKGDNIQTYPAGTDVPVTAIADAGSSFSGWSGNLSGAVNPETITMDSDKSIKANFV